MTAVEPKRFLFTMWEGGGTVPPELGVARRLIACGHSVRVLAEPSYRAAAGRLARAIAAGDGTLDVVAELERLAGARTALPAGAGPALRSP